MELTRDRFIDQFAITFQVHWPAQLVDTLQVRADASCNVLLRMDQDQRRTGISFGSGLRQDRAARDRGPASQHAEGPAPRRRSPGRFAL